MSGHITITSRGSSVVVLLEQRARTASRRTSTWRARPWQAWTCDAAVGGVEPRAGVGLARQRRPRRLAVRAHVGLDARPSSVCAPARADGGDRRCSPAAASTSCSSRASRPQDASSRFAGSAAVGSSRGGCTGAPASSASAPGPTARARGGARTGARRARRRARASTSRWPRRHPRQPEQRRAARAGRAARARARIRAHAGSRRSAGLGSADPLAQPPPQLEPARRPRPRRPRRAAHAAQHLRPVQRVAVEQVGELARRPRSAGPVARRRRAIAQVGRQRCAATARRGTRRRPRAAARQRAGAATDRRRDRRPEAVATAPPTSRPGNGNSTLAHTPSKRPSLAPGRVDRRWVSQRSIPRVGTETTSGANGSSSGVEQRLRQASARRSARSALWTCSKSGPLAHLS